MVCEVQFGAKLLPVYSPLNESSQSRKSEFRVFSIVHLNIYNF